MNFNAAPLWRQVITLLIVMLTCAGALTAPAYAQRQRIEPESGSGRTDGAVVRARHAMIVTANGHASEAGRAALRDGGTAVDAAIAAQLVLGLVEPQSSGLGGGAFALTWTQARQELNAYDGRETAPAAAKPGRFLKDGVPLPFEMAMRSGLSTGTPGLVRLLWDMHQAHGKLPWPRLFDAAIKLAEDGFPISARLHLQLRETSAEAFNASARAVFFSNGGQPHPAGFTLKNPAYAATLRAIAEKGPDGFYVGPVAEAMVEAVRSAARAQGDLTLEDLRAYTIERRTPLCTSYRLYQVCSLGPPSSGGVAIAQILQMLEAFDLGSTPDDALRGPALHAIIEAEKLAYADRERYLADPAFVTVPAGLTDPGYVADRRKLIMPSAAMERPAPGRPPELDQRAFGIDATRENVGTSHISVVDSEGNAMSMTTTIEGAFGSGLMAAGFLLNNQLTDFSFKPADDAGQPIANRIEPGKRPRSTMAPVLVFDQERRLVAVLGSPGGARIIMYLTKALVALLDWKLNAYEAAALMNFGSMGGPVAIELDWQAVLTGLRLKSYGHTITPDLMTSGLNIIRTRDGLLEGGSDPRREGTALGD